ncbi:cupin domain-containing protein [Dyadobacter crusticola]|uniref:cupin domain-containing protein n=1 Tax=Dyadobacter crusticola TaxID=292407 RepID=UPI0004E21465|nr:cupin domain-containing protein [Dyadobacter crusticola]
MTFNSDILNKIEQDQAIAQLKQSGKEFMVLFENSLLSMEIYKPDLIDKQSPHDRDEFYIVISGTGKFTFRDQTTTFKPGDFLYVPAFAEHRFIDFTDDFICWVFFVGDKVMR